MLNKKCESESIISHCRMRTNVFVAICYISLRHATEQLSWNATSDVDTRITTTICGYVEHAIG